MLHWLPLCKCQRARVLLLVPGGSYSQLWIWVFYRCGKINLVWAGMWLFFWAWQDLRKKKRWKVKWGWFPQRVISRETWEGCEKMCWHKPKYELWNCSKLKLQANCLFNIGRFTPGERLTCSPPPPQQNGEPFIQHQHLCFVADPAILCWNATSDTSRWNHWNVSETPWCRWWLGMGFLERFWSVPHSRQ